jgi:hypothetical protein
MFGTLELHRCSLNDGVEDLVFGVGSGVRHRGGCV